MTGPNLRENLAQSDAIWCHLPPIFLIAADVFQLRRALRLLPEVARAFGLAGGLGKSIPRSQGLLVADPYGGNS